MKKHKHKHYIDPMEEIKDDLDYIILKKGVEKDTIKDTEDPDTWFWVGFLVILGIIAILFATLIVKHL